MGWRNAYGALSINTAAGLRVADLSGQIQQGLARLDSSTIVKLFEMYEAGAQATRTLTYTNVGTGPLTLASPVFDAPLSTTRNTCTNVAINHTCQIDITLDKGGVGPSGDQRFTAMPGSPAQQVRVDWAIYTTEASWEPTTISFSNVSLGSTTSRTVVLRNLGTVNADWSDALLNLPPNLSANLTGCRNVLVGTTCTVTLTYVTSAAGSINWGGIAPAQSSKNRNTLSVQVNVVSATTQ